MRTMTSKPPSSGICRSRRSRGRAKRAQSACSAGESIAGESTVRGVDRFGESIVLGSRSVPSGRAAFQCVSPRGVMEGPPRKRSENLHKAFGNPDGVRKRRSRQRQRQRRFPSHSVGTTRGAPKPTPLSDPEAPKARHSPKP